MKLNSQQIAEYLPHRYPFLLVDTVEELEPMKYIRGLKNITANEPCFPGHFPDNPIFPGVLIIESLAQLTALLGFVSLREKNPSLEMQVYLGGVEKARFYRPVVPGDQLQLYSEIKYLRSQMARAVCKAMVGDTVCCSAEIISAYK